MAGFSDQATNLVEVAVVPHPSVMVVFDLGDTPFVVQDENGQGHRDSFVVGLAPHGAIAGLAPAGMGVQARSFECLQVRLSPTIAYAALGASGLGGTVVALDDLWGCEALRIQDQLRAATSWHARFAIAESVFGRHHEGGRCVDQEVAFAWDELVANEGRIRIERLAAELGWSRKRLWSRFGSQIGLTPKRAAQLIRFDHAAHLLAMGRSPSWAAAQSGYVDQSHLHRDVMAFAGQTPSAVAAELFLAVDEVAWPSSELGRGTAHMTVGVGAP
jgi:AraC-like DNA-binding protein